MNQKDPDQLSKRKKTSMTSRMMLNILVMVAVFTIMLGALWINDTRHIYDEDIKEMESVQKQYIKADLHSRVASLVDYLTYRKAETEDNLKDELKLRTYEAYDIMMAIYRANEDIKTEEEIRTMIVDALKDIRFNEGRGYYFVDALDGEVILYAINQETHGTNMLDLQDEVGNYVLQEEIELVKTKGEGYLEAQWKKPGEIDKSTYKKITFVKHFEPYDWYLGCGDYIDDFTRETQEDLLAYVNTLRYGESNEQYIFIHDYEGYELANGMYPELIGTNNYDLRDANRKAVLQEQIALCQEEGGGFLTHYWKRKDDMGEYEKLTYVEAFKDWNWVVGTGVSMAYVNQTIEEKHEMLRQDVRRKVVYISALLLVIMAVSVLVVRRYIATISRTISSFAQHMKSSSDHLVEANMDQITYNDFDELVAVTNRMTGRINHLLYHDELTGLYNRSSIHTKLDEVMLSCDGDEMAVLLADVDNFKKINAVYGHSTGDLVLRRIAAAIEERLASIEEAESYIGRYGGDSFMIVLGNVTKELGISISIELMSVVEDEFIEAIKGHTTVSIGLACDGRMNAGELLNYAGDRLEMAKEAGRNQLKY